MHNVTEQHDDDEVHGPKADSMSSRTSVRSKCAICKEVGHCTTQYERVKRFAESKPSKRSDVKKKVTVGSAVVECDIDFND